MHEVFLRCVKVLVRWNINRINLSDLIRIIEHRLGRVKSLLDEKREQALCVCVHACERETYLDSLYVCLREAFPLPALPIGFCWPSTCVQPAKL